MFRNRFEVLQMLKCPSVAICCLYIADKGARSDSTRTFQSLVFGPRLHLHTFELQVLTFCFRFPVDIIISVLEDLLYHHWTNLRKILELSNLDGCWWDSMVEPPSLLLLESHPRLSGNEWFFLLSNKSSWSYPDSFLQMNEQEYSTSHCFIIKLPQSQVHCVFLRFTERFQQALANANPIVSCTVANITLPGTCFHVNT